MFDSITFHQNLYICNSTTLLIYLFVIMYLLCCQMWKFYSSPVLLAQTFDKVNDDLVSKKNKELLGINVLSCLLSD